MCVCIYIYTYIYFDSISFDSGKQPVRLNLKITRNFISIRLQYILEFN